MRVNTTRILVLERKEEEGDWPAVVSVAVTAREDGFDDHINAVMAGLLQTYPEPEFYYHWHSTSEDISWLSSGT